MSEVISRFNGLTVGSHVFALLMLSLLFIVHYMWSGKNLHLASCPLVYCAYLPTVLVMLVNTLLAVCMSVGINVCEKADFVSVVNCVQSAFL